MKVQRFNVYRANARPRYFWRIVTRQGVVVSTSVPYFSHRAREAGVDELSEGLPVEEP